MIWWSHTNFFRFAGWDILIIVLLLDVYVLCIHICTLTYGTLQLTARRACFFFPTYVCSAPRALARPVFGSPKRRWGGRGGGA